MIRAKEIINIIEGTNTLDVNEFVVKVQKHVPNAKLGSGYAADFNSISLKVDVGKKFDKDSLPEFTYFYSVLKNYLVKASTDSGLTKVLGKPSFEGVENWEHLTIANYPGHFSSFYLLNIKAGLSYYYLVFYFKDSLLTQVLKDDFYKSLGNVFRGCEQSTKYFKNKPTKKTNADW
jgi:hypothetical protein